MTNDLELWKYSSYFLDISCHHSFSKRDHNFDGSWISIQDHSGSLVHTHYLIVRFSESMEQVITFQDIHCCNGSMVYNLPQWRIQRGAAGAGSPSPMETGAPAPSAQGRPWRREMKIAAGNENSRPCPEGAGAPIFVSIRRVSQPCLIFTPRALYGCLPASKVALLIRKGLNFAHDGALLRR